MAWWQWLLLVAGVIYLILGFVIISWALGMGMQRPPWWQVVWYILTWPRVFFE